VTKYGNRKTVVDGITFDSAKEARRYGELKLLERAGQIVDLRVQPEFELDVKGVRVCKYRADFAYREHGGSTVVEDVKSPITAKNPTYRIKSKLLYAIYGIQVREV
jgi:hypothetical protein